MATPREFNTTLLEDTPNPIQVTLILFYDYVFLKCSELAGWGTMLQCERDDTDECSVKILIGDRTCQEYYLWGTQLGAPLAKCAKRNVLMSLDLRKERIADLNQLRSLTAQFVEELQAIPTAVWYRPAEF